MTKNEYEKRVADALAGLEFLSFGLAENCRTCRRDWGYDPDEDSIIFAEAIDAQTAIDEGSFALPPCQLCDQPAGLLYGYHYRDELIHHGEACADCLAYLTNGTLPDHLTET